MDLGPTDTSLVMFTTALEEAKQLDEEYKASGRLRGPLHGVPISFKDQFEIAGKDASIGFSRYAGADGPQTAFLTCLFQLVPSPL
jgi:Asp-tRNA(Asn)/Glu-tRNA(Gln) amidotransferase A subunit family amidase